MAMDLFGDEFADGMSVDDVLEGILHRSAEAEADHAGHTNEDLLAKMASLQSLVDRSIAEHPEQWEEEPFE